MSRSLEEPQEPARALAAGPGGDAGAQSRDDRQPALRADRAAGPAVLHGVRVSRPAGGDRRAGDPAVRLGDRPGQLALLPALLHGLVRVRPLPVAGEPRPRRDIVPALPRAGPAPEAAG